MMKEKTRRADVIIPVYRPGAEFFEVVRRLMLQTVKPERIIIMNTEQRYWEEAGADRELERIGADGITEVHHLPKAEFDHGATRNRGVRYSSAPYFVCMTQDAVPADRFLLERLLKPLSGDVKLSYARQLPKKDADPVETFSRYFNYPAEPAFKSLDDIGDLGIKAYFASNVCAAYERETFDRLGGFTDRAIFNEDMIYAAQLLFNGGRIAYAADARVRHSHSYTAMEQFRRNFDLAVSQADHPEIFGIVKSESEGIRMVKKNAAWLKKRGFGSYIPKLVALSGAKYAGYRLGKMYRRLPRRAVLAATMNRSYWERGSDE